MNPVSCVIPSCQRSFLLEVPNDHVEAAWHLVLGGVIGLVALEFGGRLSIPDIHGIVSTVQAVVGRPLTQRGRGRTANDATVRGGRLQLLD
jgi:hypothetical protein